MSNTPPTNPYRSAGRPEAMFVIERLIERAALTHGFDRIELRRRNLIPADAFPYTNPLGLTYDSGEYERAMDLYSHARTGAASRNGAPGRRGAASAAASRSPITSSSPARRVNGPR